VSAAGEGFPWRRIMQLGLGVLRLPPADFWRATPRELAAAFWAEAPQALTRQDFNRLLELFPDRP